MSDDANEIDLLLARAAEGDNESLGELLTRHEDRLRRMVAFRLDTRLQRRINPSDVLQEAYLAAAQSLRTPCGEAPPRELEFTL